LLRRAPISVENSENRGQTTFNFFHPTEKLFVMYGIDSYLQSLLAELRHLPTEIEWVEFKQNYKDYEELGEYIAALANSAALCGKTYAYLVWGIHDQTHEIVGTDFKYRRAKKR